MVTSNTETLHPDAIGLDMRPAPEIAGILAEGQIAAARSVVAAIPEICAGSEAMARTVQNGGTLNYVAAGSSGLMAAADAMELGGTFSIPPAQIRIHMAGGLPTGVEMPGGTEDETTGIAETCARLSPADTVIAVSASGTTPYTIAAAKSARARGATVIGLANNPGSALLNLANHAIALVTPPEVISGSTRMGAGTAQKIALNMLSTLMAVRLGHVHDGMMVNLRADNIKLRGRAQGIVSRVAGVDAKVADAALSACDGDVKAAVLVASGHISPADARTLLNDTGGHLRPALSHLKSTA